MPSFGEATFYGFVRRLGGFDRELCTVARSKAVRPIPELIVLFKSATHDERNAGVEITPQERADQYDHDRSDGQESKQASFSTEVTAA